MAFHDQAQLIGLLPSLEELTIWLDPHIDVFQTRPLIHPLYHQHASVFPVQGPALKPLQDRLRVLTIMSDPKYSQSTAHTIKLPGFHHLQSLTVSMEHLGAPKTIQFYRPDDSVAEGTPGDTNKPCLPLSLKSLHLISCTRMTFVLLDVFNKLSAGELHLRHITLAFDMLPIPAIILCGASHTRVEPLSRKVQRWLQRLASLAQKHHCVKFLTKDPCSSFTYELEAVAKLSNSEIALVAGQAYRFSECAARSQEELRERSAAECKLFLLHGIMYLHLFCSPTFDFTRWTNIVFFHGTKKTSRYAIFFRLETCVDRKP